jgi:hypothetical protein
VSIFGNKFDIIGTTLHTLQVHEEPNNIELNIPLLGISAVILPTDDLSVQAHPLLSNRIDAMILDHMAPSSRQAYEHYKKQYSAMDISVHFKDSVLAFLTQLQEEKKFTPTTLWTVRSLILSYICHELKIEVTDMRTSKWLKKLGGIFNLCDSCYLLLFHTIFDLFYTNTRRKSHVYLLLKRFSSL